MIGNGDGDGSAVLDLSYSEAQKRINSVEKVALIGKSDPDFIWSIDTSKGNLIREMSGVISFQR